MRLEGQWKVAYVRSLKVITLQGDIKEIDSKAGSQTRRCIKDTGSSEWKCIKVF